MVPSSFMFRLREHLPGHSGTVQCRGVGTLQVVCSKEEGPPGIIPDQLTTPTAQGNTELQCVNKGHDPEQLQCKEGAFLLPIAPVWICSKFGVQKMLLRVGRKWAPVLGKKPFPKHLSPAEVPHPSHLGSHLHLTIAYSPHSHCLYGLHVYYYSSSMEVPQPYPAPMVPLAQTLPHLSVPGQSGFQVEMTMVGSQQAYPHHDPFPGPASQHHCSPLAPGLGSLLREGMPSLLHHQWLPLIPTHPEWGMSNGGTLPAALVSRVPLC